MKITKKDILSFKKISGDNNRIHFDEKYAKKFFFKKPIVHGVNLAVKGIFAFLKKKNKKILIKDIKIIFKNFTYIYEEIKIKIIKNKVIIYSDLNEKVEIDISFQSFQNKKITHNQSKFKNLCVPLDNLSIKEILPIIKNCNISVCNDSSFSHLSAALGVKTITLMADTPLIYGNYSSRMFPIIPDEEEIVTHNTLGKDKINPQKIFDKIIKIIN